MKTRTAVAILASGLAFLPAATMAQTLGTEIVAEGFEAPVFVAAPAGDNRLFVVEQSGLIWIIEEGTVLERPFLDIRESVRHRGEQGLLGLAFHPDYAINGRLFVNYTDSSGDTRIVEFQVSDDPDIAAEAARPILEIDQPAGNHNGGWIGFGPDGYLYIATGDGGGAGDRYGHGQNVDSLLAKILRIDIDAGNPYAIPPGNPWAEEGGAAETFLWGLRNPWRASFDGANLYIADVGQGAWEEVTVVSTTDVGANLGWPIMEGTHCYQANECDQTGLTLPVHEYSHAAGCSITGGYVYRGSAIPALVGHYFFADYCSGFVSSFRYLDGEIKDYRPWTTEIGDVGNVTSFGLDDAGELYITSADGRVYRIVPR